MSRNILIVILIAIIGIVIYFAIGDSDKIRKIHKKKIDSIQKINESLKDQRDELKVEVIVLNIEQDDLEKLADSLHQEAQKPIPCEHKVIIQEKEIGALRGALKKCKEVKTIQTTTIGICDELLINHELVVIHHEELHKISKKEKRKVIIKTAGITVAAGILIGVLFSR